MPVAAPRNSAMTFRIVEAFVVSYSAAAVVVVVVAIAVEHSMASVCRVGCSGSHAQMCVRIGSSEFKHMMGFMYLKLLEVNKCRG